MTREERRGSTPLRPWLLLLNIVLVAWPAVALAHDDAEEAVGRVALACCVGAVGAVIESAASAPSHEEPARLSYRGSGPPAQTLAAACLEADDVGACFDLARRLDDMATPHSRWRSLIYYRHGCWLDPEMPSCPHADELAKEMGCAHLFDCEDQELDAPPATPGPSATFDVDAAKEAFEVAEAAVVEECRNDYALLTHVRVAVVFAPSGVAQSVRTGEELRGSLIGPCVEQVFGSVRVPPFEGEPVEVKKTISLEGVPTRRSLVRTSRAG
jgi:hypothetical protein